MTAPTRLSGASTSTETRYYAVCAAASYTTAVFDLSPEGEADLEAAIAEADAGLLVPVEEVLRRMHE